VSERVSGRRGRERGRGREEVVRPFFLSFVLPFLSSREGEGLVKGRVGKG